MNSRYTPMLAAALLASVASAPLHAQDNDQPPAPPASPTLTRPLPPPPAAATEALLRYKFTVGQVIRYRTVADIDMKISMPSQNQAIPINQHIETVTRQTVLSVDPVKDAATMTVQVESMQGTTNGQPTPQSDEQKAQLASASTLVLTSTGKVLSIKVNSATKIPGFDPSKMSIYQQNGALPVRAVKPGDTWVSVINLSAFGAKITSNFQLAELTPSDGGVIAEIKQTGAGTLNSAGATALPAGLKLGGKIAMTGDQQFDVDAGSIKSQSSTAHFDATVGVPAKATAKTAAAPKSAKKSAPAAPGMSTKIHFDMTSTLTRIDGDAAPIAPAATPAAPAAPAVM